MKYWLITTEFPPVHGGGISTYCWHTAQMLAQNKNEVTVFVNDSSVKTIKEENVSQHIRLIRFNPNQTENGDALGYDIRLSLEFAHVIEQYVKKENIPDYLETQDYLGIGYYILQKKHLLYESFKNLNVILTLHAPGFLYLEYNQVPLYKLPTYWTGEIEKASILMADLVLSPSNYLIEELKPHLRIADKQPIRVFNPFTQEKESSDFCYNKNELVFFGKLTPQKGCLEMFAYLSEMWKNGFDSPIHIVGGGNHFFYPVGKDMKDYLSDKYKKHIEQGLIIFEGNISPKKLLDRLLKARVIVTPSIVDNLPYAVMEAMSLGKTVLASTNGGHTELINHSKNGFTFNHAVENDFSEKLIQILTLSEKELSHAGVEAKLTIAEKCNYSKVYEEKIELINTFFSTQKQNSHFPFIREIPKTDTTTKSFVNNLLSIVIPFYNLGNFIEESLLSIEKVNYINKEVIIVNDGSTDKKSLEVLDRLCSNFDVKIITTKNQGLAETRNFGAANADGEFIAFLDADDTVSPDYYTKAIEVLKYYNNVSFVGCWAQYFGESNAKWPTFNPEPPYLLAHNIINSSALVYKRNDFLSFGLNDPELIYGMEDYDSVISMVKNGARGVSFPELWWQYRIRKNSMAQSFTTNKELYLYKLIGKKHLAFSSEFNYEITNLLHSNGTGLNFNNPTIEVENLSRLKQKLRAVIKENPLARGVAKKIYRLINN